MTEIKLNESNENHNQQNYQNGQNHRLSGVQETEAMLNSNTQQQQQPQNHQQPQTQPTNGGQNLTSPVAIKTKSSFLDPIYRLLGLTTKNTETCSPREIGTLIMLGILLIVFMISVTGFFIMWFTDVYNDSFITKLVLSKDSIATQWWMNPPLSTHLKVHIFNYTNVDRFMSGQDTILKVQDIGPYTYSENSTKVNVTFNNNYTVSYKEHRSYTFVPELSAGKQYDRVVVPNIPFLTAVDNSKFLNGVAAFGSSIFVTATNSKAFVQVAADSLLWGYDDPLIELSKSMRGPNDPLPFEKFGLLTNRNGTSHDRYSIFTGEDDLKKLAVISEFNGKSIMDFWSTNECNRVDGTDGSQFPPYLMNKKRTLEVYIPAMCRKLPLVFTSEVNLFDGVPAWRYKTPLNVFAHPDVNPENQCFCHIESGSCAPSGVFNGSLCYQAPVFVSFPHFFSGDPSIHSHLEGIHPDPSKHQTFADIHPRLAFPIDGASRIQINVQVNKAPSYRNELKHFQDGIILPVIWIEVTSGELTDELRAMIYHSSFSANAIQLALRYGTLLTCVTTFALFFAGCYYRSRTGKFSIKDKELDSLSKNRVIRPTTEEAAEN